MTEQAPESGSRARAAERFYDRIAPDFDAMMNKYDLRARLQFVQQSVVEWEVLPEERLLDLGAGTGPFSLALQEMGYGPIALDIGPELLRVARRKGAERVMVASALELPFSDGSFACVISSECIEHTPDPELAVSESLRVLKRAGLLVLTCPNRPWRWAAVLGSRLALRPYQGLENWPRWAELEGWIDSHGGELLEHRGLHALPFTFPGASVVLPALDAILRPLDRYFLNQCIVARRR